ncbi:MAG: hypothetical protein ACO2YI_05165, partial [Aquiluna sp.]
MNSTSLISPIQNVGEDDSGSEVVMSATDIWLLCAPKSATFDVQNFLSQHQLSPHWKPQPHTPGTLQTRFQASLSDGQVAHLSSLLSKLGVVFEI